MKAMKKILFLTLIFALSLVAVASAEVAPGALTKYDDIKAVIDYLDKNGLVCAYCGNGQKLTGTWTPYADCVADCTLNLSVDVKCEKCLRHWKGATTSAAKEHVWGDAQVESIKYPTCTTDGVTTYGAKCENCTTFKAEWTENTPAAYGHTLLTELLNDNLDGYTYDASKPMSEEFAAALDNEISKWNANYDSYLASETDEYKKASYTFQAKNLESTYTPSKACEDGSLVIVCKECGEKLLNVTLPAPGHAWKLIANYVAVIPTCDTPGEFYVECEVCHVQEKVFLAAMGHKVDGGKLYIRQGGELVATIDKDDINEVTGKFDPEDVTDLFGKEFVECEAYQLVHACEKANLSLESLKVNLKDYVDGLKAESKIKMSDEIWDAVYELLTNVDVSLNKCDYISYEFGAKMLPALWDHSYDLNNLNKDYDEFTKYGEYEGSCTEPSHFFLRCNGCNKWTTQIFGAEPSHKWEETSKGEQIKAATCTENGIIVVKCTVPYCDGVKEVTTNKLPHELFWQHTGDCKQAGYLLETCKICDTVVTEVKVDAWHDPAKRSQENMTNIEKKTVVNANGTVGYVYDLKDCTKDGTVSYYCGKCEKTITETIKATGHFFNFDEKKDVNKDGKYDNSDLILVPSKENPVIDGEQDGIIKPTCNTYGYIWLQCQNPGCTETKKFKNAEKLEHFSVIDETAAEVIIIPSTCTEAGKKIEKCVCGKTRETALPLASHTPTRVDGKDVCVVCGTELDLEQHVKFNIQTTELKVTSTGVSGRGVIDKFETTPNTWHEDLYARINYNFTLDNGETVAYVACVEVDKDGSFRAASPSCPYGATLTNVAIMITTDADAQDKLISNVTNMGITVIK